MVKGVASNRVLGALRTRGGYKIFLSHGGGDVWIASQMARCLREIGAVTFLDQDNIPKGANFKQMIQDEIASCDELVALFTPTSAIRSWVWIEMGAAWIQRKPVVAVFHGMHAADLEVGGQGKAILEDINVVQLNDFQGYVTDVTRRMGGGRV
jgi:hypothetical protein